MGLLVFTFILNFGTQPVSDCEKILCFFLDRVIFDPNFGQNWLKNFAFCW